MADQRPIPRRCCSSWLAPSSSVPCPTGVIPLSSQSAVLNAKDMPTNTLSPTARPTCPTNEIQTSNQVASTTIPASRASRRPLFRLPGRATQISIPQPQANKSHPHSSSPFHATTSSVPNQSQVDQQPSTPLCAASQSKETYLPSSPDRAAPHPLSMCKTISKPQSQSIKCPETQWRSKVTRSFYLRKLTKSTTQDGPQLPSSSIELPSSVFDRKEPLPAANSNSQVLNKTNSELKEKARKSDEQSLDATNISSLETETQYLTRTLNSPRKNHQLAHIAELDAKPEETKVMKEKVQETKSKDHELEKNKEIIELQCVASDSRERIKERQHKAVQSEQVRIANQEDIYVPPQTRNKSMVDNSHQHTVMFKGEDTRNHEETKDVMSKFIPRTVANRRYPRDERSASVIVLAGENKGASMRLGSEPSSEKESLLRIDRKYKLNHDRTEASMRLRLERSSEKESLLHIDRKYKLNPDGRIEAST